MEIIDENPIRNVNFKKDFQKVKRRKVTIEPEQFWVLYDSMPENPEYLKQITLAAWCSGMRHGEIRGLKWRHIDFYNGLINLDADETKEAHGKAVGIEPIFMEQLNRIKACRGEVSKNDLVFQTPVGNPVSQSVFARRFKAATIAAGFEGLVLHDFRHSFTRRKRREGFDPSIIMANTGHRTDAMFRLYDRVDVEEIKDLAGGNRIGDAELLQGIDRVIEMAKKKSVTLGSVQSHIARKFRERAA